MASASIFLLTAPPTSGVHSTMNCSDVKLSIFGVGYVDRTRLAEGNHYSHFLPNGLGAPSSGHCCGRNDSR
jgi:hypothetical protein